MKLKDFESVVWSDSLADIQWVTVRSLQYGLLADGCSAEYAYAKYGDLDVVRIRADGDSVVFYVDDSVEFCVEL